MKVFLLACLMIGLTACSTKAPMPHTTAPLSAIHDSTWVLSHTDPANQNGALLSYKPVIGIADNKVWLINGCNSPTGQIDFDNQTASHFQSTRMMCEPNLMQVDTQMTQILGGKWQVHQDHNKKRTLIIAFNGVLYYFNEK